MTGEPRVGAEVYIPSSRYLSHGRDDFAGGLCRIVKVVDEGHGLFVEVQEHPGSQYAWAYLQEHQEVWRESFGVRRGHPDPDLRPEFNEDWS